MKNNLQNVGIIIGGKSVEHDISILSGLQVYHAIDKEKYNVIIFYITKNLEWLVGEDLTKLDTYKHENFNKCKQVTLYNVNGIIYYSEIKKPKKKQPIDVFIPVVHGEKVEDGTLSGYLEMLGATYTSSDITSSSIAQDKIYTKQILEQNNIKVVPYIIKDELTHIYHIEKEIEEKLNYPLILKPSRLGSSIGIKVVYNHTLLKQEIDDISKYGNRILIEEKIPNFKEYNMAVLKEGTTIITSSIEEVIKTNDILSFTDKYITNQKCEINQNRIIPAIIPPTLETKIQDICIKAYNIFNMKGVVRIDTLYDIDTDTLYLNEINTIPGSLSFYLFEKGNISFTKLIDILIRNAILNKQKENKYLKTFISNVLNSKTIKLTK